MKGGSERRRRIAHLSLICYEGWGGVDCGAGAGAGFFIVATENSNSSLIEWEIMGEGIREICSATLQAGRKEGSQSSPAASCYRGY